MERNRHPEYRAYLQDRRAFDTSQGVLGSWKTNQETILVENYGLEWSYTSTRDFTEALSGMLQTYNQALWESLPYCPTCLGQCCMRTGAFVAVFDLLALVLLDLPYPSLPERIEAKAYDCIYRASTGCLWPNTWRTFKCWLFFCSGPNIPENPKQQPSPRQGIAKRLKPVLDELLPEPLHVYERLCGKSLSNSLEDPLVFAEGLGQALFEILVEPLGKRFPEMLPAGRKPHYKDSEPSEAPDFFADMEWEAFLKKIDRWLEYRRDTDLNGGGAFELKWLEDVEQLEWIALGKPTDGASWLEGILAHNEPRLRSSRDAHAARQIYRRAQILKRGLYDERKLAGDK